MHAAYLVLGLAALAHGLPSPARVPSMMEALFMRKSDPTENQPQQSYICPKSTSQSPDAITKAPINTTALAYAQQQLMSWCDTNITIPPATGGQGHVETNGNASVQFCNQDPQNNIHCNSSTVRFVMDGIQCGSYDSPTEGYGQLKDTKKSKNPESWYIFYSNRGTNVSNCMDTKDLSKVPKEKQSS